MDVDLKPIEPGDALTGLSLGDAQYTPLKTFLQKHAKNYEAASLARTYALFVAQTGKAVAYITLVCGEVATEESVPQWQEAFDYHYKSYPAVKIARLAVDHRYRKYGLGRQLIDFSLGVVKTTVCPSVGCRFIVVDSKTPAVGFYEKCGFTLLDTPENKARSEPVMFIDLNKAASAA